MAQHSWSSVLHDLLAGIDLSAEDAGWAMRSVLAGDFHAAQLSALLVGLRVKGETPVEMAAVADAIAEEAVPWVRESAVDVTRVGDDLTGSADLSVAVAVTVAATGIPVVQYGERAGHLSSPGPAQACAALGVRSDLSAESAAGCLAAAGITYLFAPRFHQRLRRAATVRRALGVPTLLDHLSPLLNPGRPRAGLIGCSGARMTSALAVNLAQRDTTALIVRGREGLARISTAGPTDVCVVQDNAVSRTVVDAADYGLARSTAPTLHRAGHSRLAAALHGAFSGEPGPVRDAVAINAAAAIAAYRGLTPSVDRALADGLAAASQALDSGAARRQLALWRKATRTAGAVPRTRVPQGDPLLPSARQGV
ncbi:anthranilate phosphoribosyltransferase [Actinacidiphila bryophytorum]|uniref:Anthranilate phosphoribosyltransferase n=1 Tax=Actinacidiphila bryophytorum TaxID=1436133 RepID=A0A9W4E510_9ACTN|nr:anthranilate phosphoribosyltransferase [Actinacidiphila bryophytorum]MBM9438492.1 anthranilate phosphoribosyltransferase [Actinacidiphila bryophytorum]MBN6542898.1 anthranilate phosphoribosyltransferase [Actinacidiphila bryophytorum]CAG7613066.1 Anthranilate phosphoribosyltransferase [Actinacidiphila bryophytorum]